MKEKEFLKKFGDTMSIPIYYSLDDEGNVCIDFDSITDEFTIKLKELEEETK